MGMASITYGHSTSSFYHFYIEVPVEEPYILLEVDKAMAPRVYVEKNIEIIAPHKKIKRGKFKARGRK